MELRELPTSSPKPQRRSQKSYELLLEEADVPGIEKSDLEDRRVERDGKSTIDLHFKFQTIFIYDLWKNREVREEYYKAYTTRAPENGEV